MNSIRYDQSEQIEFLWLIRLKSELVLRNRELGFRCILPENIRTDIPRVEPLF